MVWKQMTVFLKKGLLSSWHEYFHCSRWKLHHGWVLDQLHKMSCSQSAGLEVWKWDFSTVHACMLLCSIMSNSLWPCQARTLQWVASPFSRASSWPRYQTRVSYIAGRFFTIWAIREALITWLYILLFFRSFSIILYYKILNMLSCAIQQDLVVYLFYITVALCLQMYLLTNESYSSLKKHFL